MVNLMGLLLEMLTNINILITQSMSLFKFLCLLAANTVGLVTLTWLVLVKTIINFHVDVCWRVLIWTVALISLPFRVLNALGRERQLEVHLNEMQIQLESLVWENKELEEQLQIAIKDRAIMETLLAEIEEEHDKAISQIDLLENELQDLKDENLQLSEMKGKDVWNFKAQDNIGGTNVSDSKSGIPLVADYSAPPWKSGFDGSRAIIEDLLLHRDEWVDESRGIHPNPVFLKPGSKAARPYPFSPRVVSRNLMVDEALDRRRCIALSQSLFSTMLSLLVGIIIWEAEDTCMPLVVALFTVVGMSLKSVVQFFSTIEIRPASDAVALLSFNCFVLGMLTSPTLPTVVRMSNPLVLNFADRMAGLLGFFS
ncbi:uncharacterized protein LOC143879881 isoform X2 [Tasmannia lanceolata]|uniref:uncharacterized protein LOC143879881 isoform X2 n=2 Tax=Tasmannia lanceolata TaxID=3420 RepID=UPI0040645732